MRTLHNPVVRTVLCLMRLSIRQNYETSITVLHLRRLVFSTLKLHQQNATVVIKLTRETQERCK